VSASGPVIDPTVGSAAMCPGFTDPALFAPAPGNVSSSPAPGVGSADAHPPRRPAPFRSLRPRPGQRLRRRPSTPGHTGHRRRGAADHDV